MTVITNKYYLQGRYIIILMDNIENAFEKVNRAYFVPIEFSSDANLDIPLPIGYGQTVSQPSTVRLMFEWLGAGPGDKVLDVGSGSGWTTALLSNIVGEKGSVFAVERIPELLMLGKLNNKRAGNRKARFFPATKQYGLEKYAPYDRILVSAAAQRMPQGLKKQLKVGGKMVIPIKNDILEITRTKENSYLTATHPGFSFVPLI